MNGLRQFQTQYDTLLLSTLTKAFRNELILSEVGFAQSVAEK